MQLDQIRANLADQDRGRVIELVEPFTGTPTGMKFWVAGPDSDTAHRAQIVLADELAESADNDGRVSAADRERARLNCLARLVLRWDGVEDEGKTVAFNTKNLLILLRVQWVQMQVDTFAADRRNFAPVL